MTHASNRVNELHDGITVGFVQCTELLHCPAGVALGVAMPHLSIFVRCRMGVAVHVIAIEIAGIDRLAVTADGKMRLGLNGILSL